MSAKQETYYQCDLCKYKYSFARPYWATLLTKKCTVNITQRE